MNQTTQQHDDTFEKLAMAALFVFIGLLTVVWAGAQLATLLAHGHPLHTTFEEAGKAMLAMKDHMGDPRSAWLPEQRDQLPGPVLYWAATVVAAASPTSPGRCSATRRSHSTSAGGPGCPHRAGWPSRWSCVRC